jgi:hypothetical protein
LLDFAYRKATEAGYAGSPFVPDELWGQVEVLFEDKLQAGRIEVRMPGKV